jgi:CRISPR system Cascade subunit CasB
MLGPGLSPRNLFEEGDVSATILREWWKGLLSDEEETARIRRCGDPAGVMLSPEYERLLHLLKDAGYDLDPARSYAVAAVVGLVAQVTSDTGPGASFARQMAKPVPGSKKARVSGVRFDRLLAQEQRESLYLLLIPVVDLLSGTINLADMARSLYRWDAAARSRWADDYHAAAPKDKCLGARP